MQHVAAGRSDGVLGSRVVAKHSRQRTVSKAGGGGLKALGEGPYPPLAFSRGKPFAKCMGSLFRTISVGCKIALASHECVQVSTGAPNTSELAGYVPSEMDGSQDFFRRYHKTFPLRNNLLEIIRGSSLWVRTWKNDSNPLFPDRSEGANRGILGGNLL